jgi:hypothetical protein
MRGKNRMKQGALLAAELKKLLEEIQLHSVGLHRAAASVSNIDAIGALLRHLTELHENLVKARAKKFKEDKEDLREVLG